MPFIFQCILFCIINDQNAFMHLAAVTRIQPKIRVVLSVLHYAWV